MSLDSLVRRIPGGHRVQVLVGSLFILGLSAAPVLYNPKQKKGHDLFSQEKPEMVEDMQDQLKREYREKRNAAEAASQSKK